MPLFLSTTSSLKKGSLLAEHCKLYAAQGYITHSWNQQRNPYLNCYHSLSDEAYFFDGFKCHVHYLSNCQVLCVVCDSSHKRESRCIWLPAQPPPNRALYDIFQPRPASHFHLSSLKRPQPVIFHDAPSPFNNFRAGRISDARPSPLRHPFPYMGGDRRGLLPRYAKRCPQCERKEGIPKNTRLL